MSTRRTFLKSGITAATASATLNAFPSLLRGQQRIGWPARSHREDALYSSDLSPYRALVQRGVDAARQAGAHYADIRLTFSHYLSTRGYRPFFRDDEGFSEAHGGVGVRALVDGYWGFASSPLWTTDEVVRLAREAVAQAKANNTLGHVRRTTLAPAPRVENGDWTMPMEIDPYELNPRELYDFSQSLVVYASRTPNSVGKGHWNTFRKQTTVYANTDGSLWTQRTIATDVYIQWRVYIGGYGYDTEIRLDPTGAGWEAWLRLPHREMIDRATEELYFVASLPKIPVDVGKYPVVLDARSVARLISDTIGAATELDRVMGYEANAGGTSYIKSPEEMLGTFQIGSPLLTVKGDRTSKGGVATVQWDDDSIASEAFPIVTEGRLTGFSTSRESAGMLKDFYARMNIPFRSSGCARAAEGLDAPLVQTPNLTMTPSDSSDTLDTLVKGISKGMVFKDLNPVMDFQRLNGLGRGMCFEVRNGKRVAIIENAGPLFRTTELWKSLSALGGRASVERFGLKATKGEPPQTCLHSVTTVPAVFKDMTVIDIMRKA